MMSELAIQEVVGHRAGPMQYGGAAQIIAEAVWEYAAGRMDVEDAAQVLADQLDSRCDFCASAKWRYQVGTDEHQYLCQSCFWRGRAERARQLLQSGTAVEVGPGLAIREAICAFAGKLDSLEYAALGLALQRACGVTQVDCLRGGWAALAQRAMEAGDE